MQELLEKNLYQIREFCRRNSMSPTLFHKLAGQGLGPKVIRLGAKVLISADAEREWQRAMENPTGRAAEIAAKNAATLHEKARAARQRRGGR